MLAGGGELRGEEPAPGAFPQRRPPLSCPEEERGVLWGERREPEGERSGEKYQRRAAFPVARPRGAAAAVRGWRTRAG
jgi:hypothetical protein